MYCSNVFFLFQPVITDIASLVLGYDMRRLNDVTTFRRYWYRTSLLEALFIGSKKSGETGTPRGDISGSSLASRESSAGALLSVTVWTPSINLVNLIQ